MKRVQYAVIITFVSIMAILSICSLFPDSDGFSSFENRYLSGMPVFTFEDFFSGKFGESYEKYLLDNFRLRDLSLMGYQAYSAFLYIDAFQNAEDVLMSVDVDDFVTAQNPDGARADPQPLESRHSADGRATDGSQTAGQQYSNGLQTSPEEQDSKRQTSGQQTTPGEQHASVNQAGSGIAASGARHDDGQQAGSSPQDATGINPADDDKDAQLNNSLIISGDRVMMPAGTYNLSLFGSLLSKIAQAIPDVNMYSITGPTSAAFYASEKYRTGSYDQGKAEAIIESSAKGITVVKVFDKLLKHKDENIYFRSDVHWTALGAYCAYEAFCESAGFVPASIEDDFTKGTYKPFLGGLYAQIYKMPQAARLKNNPEELDYFIPKIGHKLTLYKMGNLNEPYGVESIINTNFSSLGAYKYSCFAWGDQRIEKIETESASGRSVVVVKDSFGSAFVPFLVPNYSKIFVIDPKGFNQEGSPEFDAKTLIRDEKIDDVIFCFSIYGSGRKIIRDCLSSLMLE